MTALPHRSQVQEQALGVCIMRQLDFLSQLQPRTFIEQLRIGLKGLRADQQSAQKHVEQAVEEIQNICLPDFINPTRFMLGLEAKAPKRLCSAMLHACHYLTWQSPQRPTAAYLAALGLATSPQAYRGHGCSRLFKIAFTNPQIRKAFYKQVDASATHRLLATTVSDLVCLQNDNWNGI